MSMPKVSKLLLDETGAANTDFVTSIIPGVEEYDELGVQVNAVGGTFAAVGNDWQFGYDGSTFPLTRSATLTAAASAAQGGAGIWVTSYVTVAGGATFPMPLTDYCRYHVAALGVGVAARVRIWGQRAHKGADVPAPGTGD